MNELSLEELKQDRDTLFQLGKSYQLLNEADPLRFSTETLSPILQKLEMLDQAISKQQGLAYMKKFNIDRAVVDEVSYDPNDIEPGELVEDVTKPQIQENAMIDDKQPNYISSLINQMAAGSAGIGSGAARIPALVAEIAALPQNLIVTALGREDLEVKAPDWLKNNPIAKHYDKQAKLLTSIDEKYDKGITGLIKEGEYGNAAKLLGLQVAENLPLQISLLMGGFMGLGKATLGGMSTISAAQKSKELDENTEIDMPEYIETLNSITHGLSEGVMESLGTVNVAGISKKLIEKVGKDKATEIMKKGILNTLKQKFEKFLPVTAPIAEGLEEYATQIAQNFNDISTGVDENRDVTAGALDAFIVGVTASAMTTTPLHIAGKVSQPKYGKPEATPDMQKEGGKLDTEQQINYDELSKLGYSEEQMSKMTPEQAQEAVSKRTEAEPTQTTPEPVKPAEAKLEAKKETAKVYDKEIKTPEEWANDDGILILDPDGWRKDNKDFNEQITREEYNERVVTSTIKKLPRNEETLKQHLIDEFRYDEKKSSMTAKVVDAVMGFVAKKTGKTKEQIYAENLQDLKASKEEDVKKTGSKLLQEIELPDYDITNSTEDALALGETLIGNEEAIDQLKAKEKIHRDKFRDLSEQFKKTNEEEILQESSYELKKAQLYREAREVADGTLPAGKLYQEGKKIPIAEVKKTKGATYRGLGIDTGKNSSRYGRGLYSTPNRKVAEEYGDVTGIVGGMPTNPLTISRSSSFEDWLLQESGERNMRRFNEKYDIAEFVKSKGYDGVIDGDMIVKYGTNKILYQEGNKQWYSKLQNLITDKMPNKADPQTIMNIINKGGVKAEEIEFSGINEFLEGKKSVTKDELLSHLIENQIQVEEVVKGGTKELTADDLTDYRGAEILDAYDDGSEKWVDFGEYQGTKYRIEYYFDKSQLPEDGDTDFYPWDDADITITRADGGEIGTPGTKFSAYQEPGGAGYRELLMTLPMDSKKYDPATSKIEISTKKTYDDGSRSVEIYVDGDHWTNKERTRIDDDSLIAITREILKEKKAQQGAFTSSHFDEPNILVHIRFNERTDADGNKVLFIEEIQSDWHQKGRKVGYNNKKEAKSYEGDIKNNEWILKDSDGKEITRVSMDEAGTGNTALNIYNKDSGVPDAPFKKTWHELAMKRAIRWAAENGFDKVAWTPGKIQIDRYEEALRQNVDEIRYESIESDTEPMWEVAAYKNGKETFNQDEMTFDQIEELLGKDIAGKIRDNKGKPLNDSDYRDWHSISGDGLSIGGEGMKGFYDKIIPSFANKYGKKFGAKVEDIQINNLKTTQTIHSLPITPEMRESVLSEGQPLFQSGAKGAIEFHKNGKATIHAFEAADVSTGVHEFAHLFLNMLQKYGLEGDLNTILEWAGAKRVTTRVQEKFARGFERYLRDGKAPTEKMKEVFENFKQWLKEIYVKIAGSEIDVKLSPAMRDLFDSMLGGSATRTVKERGGKPRKTKDINTVGDWVSKRMMDIGKGILPKGLNEHGISKKENPGIFLKYARKDGLGLDDWIATAQEEGIISRSDDAENEFIAALLENRPIVSEVTAGQSEVLAQQEQEYYYNMALEEGAIPENMSMDEFDTLMGEIEDSIVEYDTEEALFQQSDMFSKEKPAEKLPSKDIEWYNEQVKKGLAPAMGKAMNEAERAKAIEKQRAKAKKTGMDDLFGSAPGQGQTTLFQRDLFTAEFKADLKRRGIDADKLAKIINLRNISGKTESEAALESIERVTDIKAKKQSKEQITKEKIIKDLEAALNVPIRIGGIRGQKRLGIFKVSPEVIRTRIANDIETAAHEIGHSLQKRLFGTYQDRERGFVGWARENVSKPVAVLKELRGMDYDQKKRRTGEGFAEFIRHYVNGMDEAKKRAPLFYDIFEQKMQTEPEIHTVLLKAREDWQRWREQPAVAQVISQISINEKERAIPTFRDIYSYSVDDLTAIEKMVDELSNKGNFDTIKDPYILARLMRGWGGKVENFLNHGQLNNDLQIVGKSLNEILKPIENNLDEFRAYAVAKRAMELKERFPQKEMEALTGFPETAAINTIAELQSAKFDKAINELYEYQNNLLQYVVDSGLLSQGQYDKIKDVNKLYVPFYRVMEEKSQKGGGKTVANLGSPIKKIKGSGRRIQDPIESIIKNTYSMINLAERNKVGLAIADMAEIEGAGIWVEKVNIPMQVTKVKIDEMIDHLNKLDFAVENMSDLEKEIDDLTVNIFRPSNFKPPENHVFIVRDGKREYYRLNPEIYKAMMAINEEQTNWLIKLIAIPAKWLRLGATLTPEFLGRNPIRDNITAYVYSKYGFKPGLDFVKGLFHVIGKTDLYWQFKATGADHSMLVSMDRDYLQKAMKDITKTRRQRLVRTMLDPLDTLRKLSEYMEAGTRVGEFRRGIKKEGTSISGRLKAAFAAREVTLDFSRKGSKSKDINRVVAFFNAQLQGIDKGIREFKHSPRRMLIRSLIGITLPSIVLYLINRDDDDYKNLPSWQKNLFWIIPMPESFKGINLFGDSFLRIPKPFELGLIFGSFPERILEWVDNNDPEALNEFADTFFDAMMPDIIPTMFKPLVENFANRSMFYNSNIVPRGLEEVEAELQYRETTSESAKEIGKLIKYPPAKIDNVFRGYFGGLGRYFTDIADKGIISIKDIDIPEEPEEGLRNYPLIRGFIARYPASNMKNIERFYKDYDKVKKVYFTLRYLDKGENIDIANDYYIKHETQITQYEQMKNIAEILKDFRKVINDVYDSNKSASQKRKEIDSYYLQMSDLVKSDYFKKEK